MTTEEIRRLKRMIDRKNKSDALVTKGIDPMQARAEENEKADIEDIKATMAYIAMMADIDLDDGGEDGISDMDGETEEIGSDLDEDLSAEGGEDNE